MNAISKRMAGIEADAYKMAGKIGVADFKRLTSKLDEITALMLEVAGIVSSYKARMAADKNDPSGTPYMGK